MVQCCREGQSNLPECTAPFSAEPPACSRCPESTVPSWGQIWVISSSVLSSLRWTLGGIFSGPTCLLSTDSRIHVSGAVSESLPLKDARTHWLRGSSPPSARLRKRCPTLLPVIEKLEKKKKNESARRTGEGVHTRTPESAQRPRSRLVLVTVSPARQRVIRPDDSREDSRPRVIHARFFFSLSLRDAALQASSAHRGRAAEQLAPRVEGASEWPVHEEAAGRGGGAWNHGGLSPPRKLALSHSPWTQFPLEHPQGRDRRGCSLHAPPKWSWGWSWGPRALCGAGTSHEQAGAAGPEPGLREGLPQERVGPLPSRLQSAPHRPRQLLYPPPGSGAPPLQPRPCPQPAPRPFFPKHLLPATTRPRRVCRTQHPTSVLRQAREGWCGTAVLPAKGAGGSPRLLVASPAASQLPPHGCSPGTKCGQGGVVAVWPSPVVAERFLPV